MLFRKHVGVLTLALTVTFSLAACDDDDDLGPDNEVFTATLSGTAAGVTTNASGTATFEVNDDDTIDFVVTANDLENFIMMHIHTGAAGENGGVVVWLRPDAPPPLDPPVASVNGLLAEGTITAPEVLAPLTSLDDLLRVMRKDSVYVNVHTVANPGGEIRGQIDPAGPTR